ncbi:MAG: hypothetical protein IJ466_03515 [Clostridia bacterium]|nr:hypothetical protein [Clostridia bacterium]
MKIVERVCELLLGATFEEIGRAADMVWVAFHSASTAPRLHASCPLRIVESGQILLSSHDIYDMGCGIPEEDFRWDDPEIGSTLFDQRTIVLNDKLAGRIVTHVEFSPTLDLRICFEGGYVLECIRMHFQEATEPWEDENYRIFSVSDNELEEPQIVF